MNKRIPIGIGICITLLFVVFLWLALPSPPDQISLQELLRTDFSAVTKIAVRYGDGNQLAIEDSADINRVVSALGEIRFRRSSSLAPVGFLYVLDIINDSQTVRFSHDLSKDNAVYQCEGPQSKQLDELILNMGREKIPGLLPGLNVN